MFFDSIKVEANDCFAIEEKPILQSNSSAWLDLKQIDELLVMLIKSLLVKKALRL